MSSISNQSQSLIVESFTEMVERFKQTSLDKMPEGDHFSTFCGKTTSFEPLFKTDEYAVDHVGKFTGIQLMNRKEYERIKSYNLIAIFNSMMNTNNFDVNFLQELLSKAKKIKINLWTQGFDMGCPGLFIPYATFLETVESERFKTQGLISVEMFKLLLKMEGFEINVSVDFFFKNSFTLLGLIAMCSIIAMGSINKQGQKENIQRHKDYFSIMCKLKFLLENGACIDSKMVIQNNSKWEKNKVNIAKVLTPIRRHIRIESTVKEVLALLLPKTVSGLVEQYSFL